MWGKKTLPLRGTIGNVTALFSASPIALPFCEVLPRLRSTERLWWVLLSESVPEEDVDQQGIVISEPGAVPVRSGEQSSPCWFEVWKANPHVPFR